MKALNLHLALLILCYFSNFCVYAQTPNIEITSNTNGLVNYKTVQVGQQTHLFTLFGDGTFSSLQEPKHKFEPNANGYTTEVYFAKAYDPNLPPKKTIHTGTTTSGSSFVNPTVQMTGDIDIFTSWATAVGYENFYIIAFRNTTSTNKLPRGCIEFYYNTQEIKVDTSNIKVYNNWVTNRVSSASTGVFDSKITWDFSNLAYNETRYIYIPAKTLTSVGNMIHIEAKYKIGCGADSSTHKGQFLSRRYPHDPNFKIVNKECLVPNLNDRQQLIYTIGFFNDGNDFAENVYVDDVLSTDLIKNSISLVDYEVAPNISISNQTVHFNFININLPGTNQNIPRIYSYDEAATYFSFKICVKPNLDTCIKNTAKIVFDTQPAFFTNTAKICSETECTSYDVCQPIRKKQAQATPKEIEQTNAVTFNVHPNPASNYVEIDINFNSQATTNFTVRLLDYSGKIIEQLSVNDNYSNIFTKKIDLKHISSGLYFMILETEHGRYTKKIMKN